LVACDAKHASSQSSVIFEGALELKVDYTRTPLKHPGSFHFEIDSYSQNDNYFKK
jgi:hypothetical protein